MRSFSFLLRQKWRMDYTCATETISTVWMFDQRDILQSRAVAVSFRHSVAIALHVLRNVAGNYQEAPHRKISLFALEVCFDTSVQHGRSMISARLWTQVPNCSGSAFSGSLLGIPGFSWAKPGQAGNAKTMSKLGSVDVLFCELQILILLSMVSNCLTQSSFLYWRSKESLKHLRCKVALECLG